MWRLPLLLLLPPLLSAPSCQQKIPSNEFDPRGREEAPASLDFKRVGSNKKLDPTFLKPSKDAYRLGAGDLLEIEIAEVGGTLARTFVMPDGMVYYDLASGINAEGSTVPEFTEKLTEALKQDYSNPLVNVSLVEVRSRRYWILGRVFKPGIFPLRQPTTVLEAVGQAGGLFTSRFSGTTEELADLTNSVVIRDGNILPVDFDKLIREGDTSQNIYLRNNDFVFLPSAQSSSVLLLGAVNEPKSVGFKDSLSLIQCIAQGRGPAEGAYLDKVIIVRGSVSKPRAATVNLRAVLTGNATDVRLQSGDIVWIPRRPLALVETTVDLIFRDAARTIALNEGANAVGSDQKSLITLPAGGGVSSGGN